MQIRRFSSDLKNKIPGNHPGLYGVLVQMNRAGLPQEKQEEFAKRWGGLPLLLDADLQVEAMYFEPHASMEEHSTDHPILFLAILGQGNVRIGGPMGETHEIQAGEAILWPAYTDHTVWTDDEALHAIVINAPPGDGLAQAQRDEEVYIKDYQGVAEAVSNVRDYFTFYNHERLHQALDYQTPAHVYLKG